MGTKHGIAYEWKNKGRAAGTYTNTHKFDEQPHVTVRLSWKFSVRSSAGLSVNLIEDYHGISQSLQVNAWMVCLEWHNHVLPNT
jgi:hypothetical protein